MKWSGIIIASLMFNSFDVVTAQDHLPSADQRFGNRYTVSVPDFQKHVIPLLGRLGCNGAKCHGSFQGQGGLRLSLFGFDFQADHAALRAEASSELGNRLNLSRPEESLLVLKPTEQIDHGGGKRLKVDSWEHHLLLRWIQSGGAGAERATAENVRPSEKQFSDKQVAFFEEKIQPLFESHCFECHGHGDPKAGFQAISRETLLQGGKSGVAVVPDDPQQSLLMQAVNYSNDDLKMPPSGKLKPGEIADLEQWIRMGVPWSDRYGSAPVETSQTLVSLYCEPAEIVFQQTGDQSQIRIVAEWESGEREDVTCLTRFQTNDDAVVSVDPSGLATAVGQGDTHVIAFYDNGVVAIPVLQPFQHHPLLNATLEQTDNPSGQSVILPIDRLVNEKLGKLGLRPSQLCSDAEFLRRVSIDMTGTLPAPDEVLEFLSDSTKDKRSQKINELLKRPAYAAWWANKLCDFTGCNPASIQSLLETATETGYVKASEWYDWIFDRIGRNQPYDDLVAGIMLAQLAETGEGMPYFWTRQSLKEPKDTAMSVAHAFLGIQLQCAECHKHPFDRWTQTDFNEFARFFDPLTAGRRTAVVDNDRSLRLLRSHKVMLQAGDDPRKPIMDWLRDPANPWFARAFVNRVWAGYFNRGIVDPPDQFTPANPASNPALLDWLTAQFIENGFDMKWLHRTIANSRTYQRSWKPNETNRNDRRNYSRAVPRRIPAEVVYDAIKQATASDEKQAQVRIDLRRRASGHLSMRMAGTHAMKVFGKPDRSLNCDCERVNAPNLLQSIFLQNDPLVRMRIADSEWIIQIEDDEQKQISIEKNDFVEQAWLRTVNRPPSPAEFDRSLRHIDSVMTVSEGISDLMWALINTKEFLLNH
ncbi:MAG: PSD1 and planctomycete cytochrome C domain-containing protein [Pirellulaceae bacterium]|nr:PSD1 and planctomycete cytochrome C domain-containing protein [Pirellulaceae bacterium]